MESKDFRFRERAHNFLMYLIWMNTREAQRPHFELCGFLNCTSAPESDSVADTADVASSPFPSARGTESSLVIQKLTAAEDTTSVTDSVDGRDNLFHRAEKSAIA